MAIDFLHIVLILMLFVIGLFMLRSSYLNRPTTTSEAELNKETYALQTSTNSNGKPTKGKLKQNIQSSAQNADGSLTTDTEVKKQPEKPKINSMSSLTSNQTKPTNYGSRKRKNTNANSNDIPNVTGATSLELNKQSSHDVVERSRATGTGRTQSSNKKQYSTSPTDATTDGATSQNDNSVSLQQQMPDIRTQSMTNCELALFIDNSNLFIEGKKSHARRLKLVVPEDLSFRIDFGNLCCKLLDGRRLDYGKLYGSEPRGLDTFWKKIHERILNVQTSGRDRHGKEKEVDNALTSDATEIITLNREKPGTVILVAGDRDYCPVVQKMLVNKWRVELAAFELSISTKLRELQEDTEHKHLFTITKLESIFDDKPPWYYTDRIFKPYRSRQDQDQATNRRRIPTSNTMVVELQEQLNAENKLQKLQKLADGLTSCLRVPCLIHLHCDGKSPESSVIFVIGVVRLKEKRRSTKHALELKKILKDEGVSQQKFAEITRLAKGSLRQILQQRGIGETAANDVIGKMLNSESEIGEESSKKINFCSLWREKQSHIDKLFRTNFGSVKSCKTMVDYKNPSEHSEEIPTSNRYTILYDRSENPQDEDDSSVSYSSGEEDDKCEELTEEEKAEEVDDDKGFEEVSRSKKAVRKGPMHSEMCPFSFSCRHGKKCHYKHEKTEMEFFKRNNGVGTSCYKSKPCTHFISGRCSKGQKKISPLCTYYHSLEESRCYKCKLQGGEIGHPETDCPQVIRL